MENSNISRDSNGLHVVLWVSLVSFRKKCTRAVACSRSNRVTVQQPVRNAGIKEIEIMIKKIILVAATVFGLMACGGDDATGTGTGNCKMFRPLLGFWPSLRSLAEWRA